MTMEEGKSKNDAYQWAFEFASCIDESFDAENDDMFNELVSNKKVSNNGLCIWDMSSITNNRHACAIGPSANESTIDESAETEDNLDENAPSGININEADWKSWKSSHSVSLYNFMASSAGVDFNWTIPESSDSNDKICYVVDENNKRLDNIYMMYGVQSQKITYASLYTDDPSALESDEYKTNLRKLIKAYTAEYKDGEVSIVISDERADEIIDYIIDHRIEHCLVDGMKIRGLFSDDDNVYGITLAY